MVCPYCNNNNVDNAASCSVCGMPLGAPADSSGTCRLSPGVTLQSGSYTVGKVLGQGGFGITYLGSDSRLRRPTAIKEFFPQGSVRHSNTVQPSGAMTVTDFGIAKTRFLDEARVLALFQHPSIVKVYASFEENNTAYMVMEYLSGRTLLGIVEKRGRLTESEAVAYIGLVAGALSTVHQRGRLHRDIKPENIILTDDKRVVLIDFGSAREFAAGRTKRMTAMLTPGYAPLEQYGQQARFGVFTDVYALGATLYHLLTGQVPVQATDRATGVRLGAPNALERSISQVVSDAVMWAMEMKVDKRPQSVQQFVQALSGINKAPTTSTRSRSRNSTASPPSERRRANPYEPQLEQVVAQMGAAVSFQFKPNLCPDCRSQFLREVTGASSGKCPVCRAGALQQRKYARGRCPICGQGSLNVLSLRDSESFCPVCKIAVLGEEVRSRFFIKDKWLVCPHCKAEFDVRIGGKVKFVQASKASAEFVMQYQDQALGIEEWRRMSTRQANYAVCGKCSAQFDKQPNGTLFCRYVQNDPNNVLKRYNGLSIADWSKVAVGMTPNQGDLFCQCGAEFDISGGTMVLRSHKTDPYNVCASRLNKPMAPAEWYLIGTGKRSGKPGYICPSCSVEFDREPSGLRLVSASKTLGSRIGAILPLDDWQRLAAGAPTRQEEQGMSSRLDDLLKKSVTVGAIQPNARISGLRPNETGLIQVSARKCRIRTRNYRQYWSIELQGSLVLTDGRLVFRLDATRELWQKSVKKFTGVEIQQVSTVGVGTEQILAVRAEGVQNPVGFTITDVAVQVSYGAYQRTISLTPLDIAAMVRTIAGL